MVVVVLDVLRFLLRHHKKGSTCTRKKRWFLPENGQDENMPL